MKIVRTDEERRQFQTLRDMKLIKTRIMREFNRQELPPEQKCYNASIWEATTLLDAGADILECRRDGDSISIRMMYEGIPVKFESPGGLEHPRLPL